MKRVFLLYLLSLLAMQLVCAQNISVKSFKLLENDLTANLKETMVVDQNGEVAALIKIITTETGFLFDVGAIGITKTVQMPGEIWLYVPHGTQRIEINHQKLGRLAEPYYFPVPIQQARTYELVLTTNLVKTIVVEDAGGGFLSLSVTPPNAVVYVDDELQSLDADGTLSLFLPYGEHTYRVDAAGCKSESGKVNFNSEEVKTLNIVLQETDKSLLTVTSEMSDAEIWVNNKQMGWGEWKGSLRSGTYVVEARKLGHRPQRQTITLASDEARTVALDAPEPMYGRLRADSKPSGAEVWVGDRLLGTTPGIFDNVLAFKQNVIFRKKGYADQTVEVAVSEGKVAVASVKLQEEASPLFSPEGNGVASDGNQDVSPSEREGGGHERGHGEGRPLLRRTGFYIHPRYTVGCPSAGGAAIGASLNGFVIEATVDIAIGSVITANWRYTSGSTSATFQQPYDPDCMLGGNIGYGMPLGRRIRLTPLVGAEVLSVSSHGVGGYSQGGQMTYVCSGTASLRGEIALTRWLSLTVTPMYRLPLQRGTLAEQFGAINDTAARWNSGFALQAGFSLNF